MLIAFALLVGGAAAQPLAVASGDGGGQAQGQAQGDYYADASGALDKADESEDELSDRAYNDARNANNAYTEAKNQAWSDASEVETPQRPACDCDEIADELEHKGTMSASHADSIEKAADLETEYIDAGADVGASGQADAWFSDLFNGASDAFDRVQAIFGYETQADEEAKDLADDAVHADDELRSELIESARTDAELPRPNPRLDGSLSAQHASEVATSAVGEGEAEIP